MFDAIILGIVQGLTEFLPVSSSAHLVFTQALFGWKEPELLFDVTLHIATLAAVLIYFRKDIVDALKGDFKYLLLLAAATVPTGIIGFLAKDFVESLFSSVRWSAIFLLCTGTLLFIAEKFASNRKGHRDITFIDAFIIGIVQGIAVLPGISRSGATISAALLLGLEKAEAAKFSFLLSVPAVAGAALLAVKEFAPGTNVTGPGIAAGSGFALLAGILAIYLIISALLKNKLSYFAYYCWAVGIAVLLLTK